MNIVWRDQPVESQQVIDELAAPNDWTAATIKTMLHRLQKKGVLTFKRDGKRYLYSASVRKNSCIRQASRTFLDRVFGGDAVPALAHFVKNSQLSQDEVAELRRLLEEKEGSL